MKGFGNNTVCRHINESLGQCNSFKMVKQYDAMVPRVNMPSRRDMTINIIEYLIYYIFIGSYVRVDVELWKL